MTFWQFRKKDEVGLRRDLGFADNRHLRPVGWETFHGLVTRHSMRLIIEQQ